MAEWLGREVKKEGSCVNIGSTSPTDSPTCSLNVIPKDISLCTKACSNQSITCRPTMENVDLTGGDKEKENEPSSSSSLAPDGTDAQAEEEEMKDKEDQGASKGSKNKKRIMRRGSYVGRARKNKLKKRLEEERMIALSSSTEEDADKLPEFEEVDSDLAEEIIGVLNEAENDAVTNENESSGGLSEAHWSSGSSTGDFDNALIGLLDADQFLSTPTQVDEEIIRRVMQRTGSGRERSPRLSVNDIGGPDTLRSVWSRLKHSERLRGVKRQLSVCSHEDSSNNSKRVKVSLNLSDKCDKLSEILLDLSSNVDDLDASVFSNLTRDVSLSNVDDVDASVFSNRTRDVSLNTLEENFGEGSICSLLHHDGDDHPHIEEKSGESSISSQLPALDDGLYSSDNEGGSSYNLLDGGEGLKLKEKDMGGRNDGEDDDQACGDEMKLESSCENMMCQGRVVLEGVNEAGGGQFTTNSVVESFCVERYSDKENFTLI